MTVVFLYEIPIEFIKFVKKKLMLTQLHKPKIELYCKRTDYW